MSPVSSAPVLAADATMDVLSAATETVANADAMEAAAMKASKLPTGPTPPADADAAAPADGAGAGAAGASANAAETTPAGAAGAAERSMDVDEGAPPSRAKDNGAPPPPAVLPAVRAAHEALLKNAEDIKSGERERQRESVRDALRMVFSYPRLRH